MSRRLPQDSGSGGVLLCLRTTLLIDVTPLVFRGGFCTRWDVPKKKSTKIHTDLLLVFKNPIKKAYGFIYSELEM